jgi:membrane protein
MAGALGTVTTLAKETVTRWAEDKASTLAAALAYYSLFSLAPLVLIAVAVAGLVFGQQAAEGETLLTAGRASSVTPAPGAAGIVANMSREQSRGSPGHDRGRCDTLIFGATGVFASCRTR